MHSFKFTWTEFATTALSPFAKLAPTIDGFDPEHPVHVLEGGAEGAFGLIYHNAGEPKGSLYYWGAAFWCQGRWDGDCGDDLDALKARIEQGVNA